MSYHKILLSMTLALASCGSVSAMERIEQSVRSYDSNTAGAKQIKKLPAKCIFKDTRLATLPPELRAELGKYLLATHAAVKLAYTLIHHASKKDLATVAFLILFHNNCLELEEKRILIDSMYHELSYACKKLVKTRDSHTLLMQLKKQLTILQLFKEVTALLVQNQRAARRLSPGLSLDRPLPIPSGWWLYYAYHHACVTENSKACAFLAPRAELENEEYRAFSKLQPYF